LSSKLSLTIQSKDRLIGRRGVLLDEGVEAIANADLASSLKRLTHLETKPTVPSRKAEATGRPNARRAQPSESSKCIGLLHFIKEINQSRDTRPPHPDRHQDHKLDYFYAPRCMELGQLFCPEDCKPPGKLCFAGFP
jgi:hypothetical protein